MTVVRILLVMGTNTAVPNLFNVRKWLIPLGSEIS